MQGKKEFMERIGENRKEYLGKPSTKRYRELLKETRFHPLQFAFIQKRPKLLWELRYALPVFFWLISHINRNDGTHGTVWAELDRLYKAGYLVTARHISHMSEELGCDSATISRALRKLEEVEFIQIARNYTWGSAKTGWYHANLYIFGYVEEEGEIWLYHTACQELDSKCNIAQMQYDKSAILQPDKNVMHIIDKP